MVGWPPVPRVVEFIQLSFCMVGWPPVPHADGLNSQLARVFPTDGVVSWTTSGGAGHSLCIFFVGGALYYIRMVGLPVAAIVRRWFRRYASAGSGFLSLWLLSESGAGTWLLHAETADLYWRRGTLCWRVRGIFGGSSCWWRLPGASAPTKWEAMLLADELLVGGGLSGLAGVLLLHCCGACACGLVGFILYWLVRAKMVPLSLGVCCLVHTCLAMVGGTRTETSIPARTFGPPGAHTAPGGASKDGTSSVRMV